MNTPMQPIDPATTKNPALPKAKRRRELARLARRALGLVVALSFGAILVYAFVPKPLDVDTERVRRGDLRVTVDEDGTTRVKDRYVVAAPLAGDLARVELHPGDSVKEGDVIARLVPSAPPLLDPRTRAELETRVSAAAAGIQQASASVDRARVAVALAEDQLARARVLVNRGSAPQQDLDRAILEQRSKAAELSSAEFGARIARHELETARAALARVDARAEDRTEQLEVRAPIDGRVLRVERESEGPIAPGAAILELGNPLALELVVDVLTTDAVKIRPGAVASIERWGGREALAAHVRLVEPSAFTRVSALGVEEQRVNVVLDLDGSAADAARLGDGYRIEARIVTTDRPHVLLVPESAIFRRGDARAVFVVRDGHAKLRTVRVGEGDGLHAEVLGGLSANDEVIVHPSDLLEDGMRVAPRSVGRR